MRRFIIPPYFRQIFSPETVARFRICWFFETQLFSENDLEISPQKWHRKLCHTQSKQWTVWFVHSFPKVNESSNVAKTKPAERFVSWEKCRINIVSFFERNFYDSTSLGFRCLDRFRDYATNYPNPNCVNFFAFYSKNELFSFVPFITYNFHFYEWKYLQKVCDRISRFAQPDIFSICSLFILYIMFVFCGLRTFQNYVIASISKNRIDFFCELRLPWWIP